MKNFNSFCQSFQKVQVIYYINSLHIRVKYFKLLFIFLSLWWLCLTDNETPKLSVSENINITEDQIKKIILNTNVSPKLNTTLLLNDYYYAIIMYFFVSSSLC